jgi:hypothetical protein
MENRPSLVDWMTNERFQQIMRAVAEATWGMNGGLNWDAQTAFFRSESGKKYFQEVSRLIALKKQPCEHRLMHVFQRSRGTLSRCKVSVSSAPSSRLRAARVLAMA